MSYDDINEVNMSGYATSTESGQGLYTQALVTHARAPPSPSLYVSEPMLSEERLDKFLAHLDEDDGEEAPGGPETLRERSGDPVDEVTVQQQLRFNEKCVAQTEDLTHGVRSSYIMSLKHHIYEPRNKVITNDNEMRVNSYDWGPNQAGRRSFGGFPDQIQFSPPAGIVNGSRG